MKTIATQWKRAKIIFLTFFLRPASYQPLAALRISVAAVLIIQALLITPEFFEFFGSAGLMQEPLQQFLTEPGLPRLAPYVKFLASWNISETLALGLVGGLYLFALINLMAGFCTRFSAGMSWFLHWVFMNTSSYTNYGVDVFAHIFLFYLIFIPSGRAWSMDKKLWEGKNRSWTARISLRILQLHLCLVYLSSGLDKIVGPQWQNGEVIWRSLMLPVYNQYDFSWLAGLPWLAKALSWGSLAIELGYSVFIWPSLTRKSWVAMTVGLHLGITLFLGLHMFGILMMTFTWALFGLTAKLNARRDVPAIYPLRLQA